MRNSLCYCLLSFLLLTLISCKDEPMPNCTCGIENPEVNIQWLKEFLSTTTYANVYKLELDKKEYIICTTVPGLDAVSFVFDCEGNFLCKSGANYTGENTCNFLSPSWDSTYPKRVLIYEKRNK